MVNFSDSLVFVEALIKKQMFSRFRHILLKINNSTHVTHRIGVLTRAKIMIEV